MRMRLSRRAVTSTTVLGLVGAAAAIAPGALAVKPPPATTATVYITPGPTATISEAGGALSVTLQRNTSGSPGSKVHVQTFDGTANDGSDYTGVNQDMVIPSGSMKTTFVIPIINDTVAEKSETFVVKLTPVNVSDPQYAQVDKKKNSLTVTITDNDPCPALSVNDQNIPEGGSGTFTVSMATTCALPVQVHWSVADNTPTADATGGGNTYPADYNNTQSGNVAIPSGSTTATFNVSSNQDTVDEPNQTFRVLLSSPVNSSIADGTGVATIIDDDAAVKATLGDDQSVWGGDTATVAVNLSAASEFTVTVNVGTDDPDSTAGVYTPDAGTDVVFPPGATTENYNLSTIAVTTPDDNGHVWIQINSATNATFDPLSTFCGLGCTTDSWARVIVKNTVPYNTTVTTDAPGGTATSGTTVTETVTVTNKSGDPLPGVVIRGELYRDFDFSSDFEADGNLIAETGPAGATTDSNGQVTSSYTDSNGLDEGDYLFACVPGFEGATLSDCGFVTGFESGDNEDIFTLPTPPSTKGYTTVHWTP